MKLLLVLQLALFMSCKFANADQAVSSEDKAATEKVSTACVEKSVVFADKTSIQCSSPEINAYISKRLAELPKLDEKTEGYEPEFTTDKSGILEIKIFKIEFKKFAPHSPENWYRLHTDNYSGLPKPPELTLKAQASAGCIWRMGTPRTKH